MPQSPYRTTVYPPIQNVDEYKRELNHHRASWEDEERDKYRDEALLVIGEALVEHCNFLEEKLDIKVCIYHFNGTLPSLVDRNADGACMRLT